MTKKNKTINKDKRAILLRYTQFVELWKRLEKEYPDLYNFLPYTNWMAMERSELIKLNREVPEYVAL
jgi:hypothetical protein